MEYSHKLIEKKWQKIWSDSKTFKTTNNSDKKAYILDMFPYPSGAGLHVGHPKGYTATDVIARLKKLQGFDVLHPIGWDAFGLPAEQYALSTGNHPRDFTTQNINNFRHQLKALGFSYDYDKEINTTDPSYFRQTQWIFTQLFKNGLAEIRNVSVNWCEELGTVLANEEVINENGKMVSERGSFPVFKKPMRQWVLKITNYADSLLEGLEKLDWPHSVKELQKNWIGRTEGHKITFNIPELHTECEVFTTRADAIFGVSFLAIAPESELAELILKKINNPELFQYIDSSKTKTDLERQNIQDRTGIATNLFAINPVNQVEVPIYIADYVLDHNGYCVVMGIPGHDEHDFLFAKKYKLAINYIIYPKSNKKPFLGDGEHINSDFLNRLNTKQALEKIEKYLLDNHIGEYKVTYKLRDWLFSRQRFWGEPFPIIHLEDGTIILEDQLPLLLPETNEIRNSKTVESPLANFPNWLNVIFNGKKGTRETNTMPQWAGSCWYYLAYILKQDDGRYIDLDSPKAKDLFKKWLPVDLYIGGQEHAVLHLLYARFWHHFLYDIGVVPTKEPFQKLINQGMILGPDNTKMSKSKGNVISPDDIIDSHGADALRLYEMFMGPLEASLPWDFKGLDSARKWIDRVYRIYKDNKIIDTNNHELDYDFNLFIKKTTKFLENHQFNNAISEMMIFINKCYQQKKSIYKNYFVKFITVMSLFTPHIAQEIWSLLSMTGDVSCSEWPTWDENLLIKTSVTIAIQVMGKLKQTIELPKDLDKESVLKLVKKDPKVQDALQKKIIIKEIFVPNRVVNFVIK